LLFSFFFSIFSLLFFSYFIFDIFNSMFFDVYFIIIFFFTYIWMARDHIWAWDHSFCIFIMKLSN